MKKSVIYLLVVCALSTLAIWVLRLHKTAPIVELLVTNSTPMTKSTKTASPHAPLLSQTAPKKTQSFEEWLTNMTIEQASNIAADYRRKIEEGNWEWKTPIELLWKSCG